MSKKASPLKQAAISAAILAAVTEYKGAGKTLADAITAQREADTTAATAQEALNRARKEVAHQLRRAGLTSVRCAGLLLSVDDEDEDLAACEDRFVEITA